jgi:hypothetical protein
MVGDRDQSQVRCSHVAQHLLYARRTVAVGGVDMEIGFADLIRYHNSVLIYANG